jgi:hypothetical protein
MGLILRGGEFITTEALNAGTLARLSELAVRRPLVINGIELQQHELAKLTEEAQRTGQPVWPRLSPGLRNGFGSSLLATHEASE